MTKVRSVAFIVLFVLLVLPLTPSVSRAQGPVTVVGSFPTGPRPFGMTIHPGLNRGYVTSFADNRVEVYDLPAGTPIATIPGICPVSFPEYTTGGPRWPVLSPDGSVLAVPCLLGQAAVFVRTADHSVAATVFVGNYPSLVGFSHDSTRAFIVTAGLNYSFTVVDTSTFAVVKTIPLPPTDLNNYFAVSPDDSIAIVANPASGAPDKVTFIDLVHLQVDSLVTVGDSPREVVLSADGATAWVANQGSSTVSRLDVASRTVVGTFPTALGPVKLALLDGGSRLVVVCPSGSVTQILDAATGALLDQAPTPGTDSGAAGSHLQVLRSDKLALVSAPFSEAVYVIDTDSASPDFGSVVQALSPLPCPGWFGSCFPTVIVLGPDGLNAYVVNYLGANITVLALPLRLVEIDIKPGSDSNSINPQSRGTIPVAILTTGAFDVATVDQAGVRFGAWGTEAAPVHSALEDVDGDGDMDMVLHFPTQDTDIACGDTSATVTGSTMTGEQIHGEDSIRTVGCP